MSFEKIIDAPRLNRFKTKILNLVYQKGDVYNKNEIDNKFSQLETNIDWKDSILTDTDTELDHKLTLQTAGILSKAEVRAWYTGESVEAAQLEIDKMQEQAQQNMMNDLFNSTSTSDNSLESNPDDKQDMSNQENQSNNEG